MRQAEALTLIVSTITQCLESLNAKAEFSGAILGLRNACIDLLATLCTRAAQAPEAPTNGRDTTSFGPHTNGQSSQAIVLRSNAAGLPDSSDAADAAAPSVPVLLTSRCLDVLSAAAASTSDRVEIWPAQSNAEYLRCVFADAALRLSGEFVCAVSGMPTLRLQSGAVSDRRLC